MRTKPRGIHATFETDCERCGDIITVTNGKVSQHECYEEPQCDVQMG